MVRASRPWLWISPQLAHDLSPLALNLLSGWREANIPHWRPLQWRGLTFPNPLGTSGGVDKNAENLKAWWALGAGFQEVGTITPLAQKANPGQVVDRDLARLAIWNQLGFPSHGLEVVKKRLENLPPNRPTPVFANIGKNRETNLEEAHLDYLKCLTPLQGSVDAFVINISSPNTVGLRELLKPARLESFLKPIREASKKTPVFLKLSPDLDPEDLENALGVSLDLNLDGWILNNTTLSRDSGLKFSERGGVSGLPLQKRSEELLKKALGFLGSKKQDRLMISSGGILNSDDVKRRLDLGADLLQTYSALIFSGPWFFKNVAKVMRVQK